MESEHLIKKNEFWNLEKSKNDSCEYLLKILPNGFKILIIYDTKSQFSAANLVVNAGSLLDPKGYPGIAHLCEHMLTCGSEKYPDPKEYREYIKKNGGSNNASTSYDYNSYYFTISNNAIKEALERLADSVIHPLFDRNFISKEIHIIDSENEQKKLLDGWRFRGLTLYEAKKDSLFCGFSTGNIQTLDKPEIRDKLLEYYNKYYSPSIMNLCVYSNIPLVQMSEYLTNLFSTMTNDNKIKPNYIEQIMPYDETNLGFYYQIESIQDRSSLVLKWHLPFEGAYYKEMPLEFITYLIAHEGPNSITSSLLKDNLIKQLVGTNKSIVGAFSTLDISIELTKKGMSKVKEIIFRIFKYISNIKEEKINKRCYDELKLIKQLLFDYKNKDKAIDAVVNYGKRLLQYKPEDILTGGMIAGEFNEDLIIKYLNLLTPNNCNVYLFKKKFEFKEYQTEKWYGVKYIKEKFNLTNEQINQFECPYPLGYPVTNLYFPESIEVLSPPEPIEEYPVKILKNKRCTIWHKQDTTFLLPKSLIFCKIYLQKEILGYDFMMRRTIGKLMTKIIKYELGESLYMANLANIVIDFTIEATECLLGIQGFSSSMEKAIINYFEEIIKISYEKKGEMIKQFIKSEIQNTNNIYLKNICRTPSYFIKNILYYPCIEPEEYIAFLKKNIITSEHLVKYSKVFLNCAKYEWLIQGNISKDQSLKIVNLFNSKFNIDLNQAIIDDFEIYRTVEISNKNNYIYTINNPKKEETQSSVAVFYQCGKLSYKDELIFEFCSSFLQTKIYEEIRVKEKIGYVVFILPLVIKKVVGCMFVVQTKDKAPHYANERIKIFIENMRERIQMISDDEFNSHLNNVMIFSKKKDLSLEEEFLRNLDEIFQHSYRFSKKKDNCELVNSITKEDVFNFFNVHFCQNYRTLEIEYVSKKHKEENEKLIGKTLKNKQSIRIDSGNKFIALNGLYPDFSYEGIN